MIHIRLPDGATRALDPASTAADLAAGISPRWHLRCFLLGRA